MNFDKPKAFLASLRDAMTSAPDIEQLFAVWEQNVETVRAINKQLKCSSSKDTAVHDLVAHLRSCAVTLATPGDPAAKTAAPACPHPRGRIDKSLLTLSEPKRIRSKEHLRFVARQPCLVCGRTPSHAHHVRYAQSRGLGLKVSDEFAVPLRAIHHTENHATGDERGWWKKYRIEPLEVARTLWRESTGGMADAKASVPEPRTGRMQPTDKGSVLTASVE
jgi:hypothetical protein